MADYLSSFAIIAKTFVNGWLTNSEASRKHAADDAKAQRLHEKELAELKLKNKPSGNQELIGNLSQMAKAMMANSTSRLLPNKKARKKGESDEPPADSIPSVKRRKSK